MRVWFVLLSVWLLASCVSHAPKVHYYLLAEPNFNAQPASAAAPIALGHISLADYLGGTGLVVEQAGTEVVLTRQHRWAEPLDRQLQRQMRQGLGQLYPDAQWRLHTQQTNTHYQLDVLVDTFNVTAENAARVQVEWHLQAKQRGTVHTGRHMTEVALAGEGYDAAVVALSEAWHQVLQGMAMDVQEQLKKQARVASNG